MKWLAPTDLFLEFGAETGNGDGFPATRLESNGFNGATLVRARGWRRRRLHELARRRCVAHAGAEDREGGIEDASGEPLFESFTGDSDTWVVDGVLKWAPSPRRQLKVQGEYMHRRENGEIFDGDGAAGRRRLSQHAVGLVPAERLSIRDALARWRCGTTRWIRAHRVMRLRPTDLLDASPDRVSLMLDWNPSEFSRLRAQYDWDNARDDGDTDRILRLQYIYGIGAHGAHKY